MQGERAVKTCMVYHTQDSGYKKTIMIMSGQVWGYKTIMSGPFEAHRVKIRSRKGENAESAGPFHQSRRVKMRSRQGYFRPVRLKYGLNRVKMRSRQGYLSPAGWKCGVDRVKLRSRQGHFSPAGPGSFQSRRVTMRSRQGHFRPVGLKYGVDRVKMRSRQGYIWVPQGENAESTGWTFLTL